MACELIRLEVKEMEREREREREMFNVWETAIIDERFKYFV